MFTLSWFRRRGITFAQGAMNIAKAVITTLDITDWPKVDGASLDRMLVKSARVKLNAADAAGGVFAWKNPEDEDINVIHMLLDVTTKTSAACTVSVGIADNATTLGTDFLSGQSVATAGIFANSAAKKVGKNKFVTGSKASGAIAGLVGFAYITYVVCAD